MRKIEATLYGVDATLYICNLGEGQTAHQHAYPHGHWVIRGRTVVIIGDQAPRTVTHDDGNIELPANIDHSIQAIDDLTCFINAMVAIVPTASNPVTATVSLTQTIPQDGGVLLMDGTVVR